MDRGACRGWKESDRAEHMHCGETSEETSCPDLCSLYQLLHAVATLNLSFLLCAF